MRAPTAGPAPWQGWPGTIASAGLTGGPQRSTAERLVSAQQEPAHGCKPHGGQQQGPAVDFDALEVQAEPSTSHEALEEAAHPWPGQGCSAAGAAASPADGAVPETPGEPAAGPAAPPRHLAGSTQRQQDAAHAQDVSHPEQATSRRAQAAEQQAPAPRTQRSDVVMDIFNSFGQLTEEGSCSSNDEQLCMELGTSSNEGEESGAHELCRSVDTGFRSDAVMCCRCKECCAAQSKAAEDAQSLTGRPWKDTPGPADCQQGDKEGQTYPLAHLAGRHERRTSAAEHGPP